MLEYHKIKPGDIIISSPNSNTGTIFSKSVIYIISHDELGTYGVIVNKFLKNTILDSTANNETSSNLAMYSGGPIEQSRGIILHSNDYTAAPLMKVTSDILISSDTKIIKAIIANKGPKAKMLILGYASWLPNQLFTEIKDNYWLPILNASSSEIFKLVFLEESNYKWDQALKLTGINLANYAPPGNA